MNKCLLLLAATATIGCTVPARAVWDSDPQVNLLVSPPDAINQDLPLITGAPNSGSFISWLSWENESASLKLQCLDKEGNTLWAQGGIYVTQNLTPTWSSGYDMTSDSDGNAVIVYSDKRNGVWQAYAYKVSDKGEMLWGDGVLLPTDSKESSLNPKVAITPARSAVFGFQALAGSRNSIKIAKLNSAGTKMWGGLIEVTGTNGLFNLVAGEGDSFYLVYFEADKANLSVMRYTANGEPAWDKPTVIDAGSAIVSAESLACSDGRGGVVVGWRHALTDFTYDGRLQRVDAAGRILWEESVAFVNLPTPGADAAGNIYAAYSRGSIGQDNLQISQYDSAGEHIWDTPRLLDYDAYQVSIYGLRSIGDEVVVAYRNALDYNMAQVDYAHIDPYGDPKVIEGKISTMEGDKGRGGLYCDPSGQIVLAWGDNGGAKGGGRIYAQNALLDVPTGIDNVDAKELQTTLQPRYTGSGIELGDCTGVAYLYDMTGALMTSGNIRSGVLHTGVIAPGLYVVKVGDKAAKIAVR